MNNSNKNTEVELARFLEQNAEDLLEAPKGAVTANSDLLGDIEELTKQFEEKEAQRLANLDPDEEAEKVEELISRYPTEGIIGEQDILNALRIAAKRGDVSLWAETSKKNPYENTRFTLKYMRVFEEIGVKNPKKDCVETGTLLSWRPKGDIADGEHAKAVAAQFAIAAQVLDALIASNRPAKSSDQSESSESITNEEN